MKYTRTGRHIKVHIFLLAINGELKLFLKYNDIFNIKKYIKVRLKGNVIYVVK